MKLIVLILFFIFSNLSPIKKIIVKGSTILSVGEINKIIRPFEGQMLGLRDMQKVVNLITEACRQKGFVTFRAILPLI